MRDYLVELLKSADLSQALAEYISIAIIIILLFLLVLLSYLIIKPILINIVTSATQKSKTNWDDILLQHRVFHKTTLLIPALIIYVALPYLLNIEVGEWLLTFVEIYFIAVIVSILSAFLDATNTIFSTTKKGKYKSIKGYIQVAKIIIYFIAGIVLFSTLTGKNAFTIFAGLGAFAAVFLLIFQDAIKGLASGVQLSANDMVRIGDWISMPKYDADGTVIELALTTVKVQNWDKTISMIPSYALVSQSFSNWRGMEESGGRRIKRSIFIDVNSIHFLSENEKEQFSKIALLGDYIVQKDSEINDYNKSINHSNSIQINGRRLTNIGTLRRYLKEYIGQNQYINHDMTFMVRQLQSSEKGLPIEIYAFSKVQAWEEYESIQADIFDHVFAAVQTFNLRIFQNPTGSDFQSLNK